MLGAVISAAVFTWRTENVALNDTQIAELCGANADPNSLSLHDAGRLPDVKTVRL